MIPRFCIIFVESSLVSRPLLRTVIDPQDFYKLIFNSVNDNIRQASEY